MNSFINKLILLGMALLVSCECVPNIVSPNIKEPTEFASVNFINSVPDYDSMDVWEGSREVQTKIGFSDVNVNYKKITSGTPNIRFANTSDQSIFYNSILDFTKDSKYTLVAFGSRRRYDALYLNDSIANYNQNNAYVRFINTSPDSPAMKFVIKSYPLNPILTFKEYTDFKAIPVGSYELSVVDTSSNKEVLNLKNLDFKQGNTYNLVLKGYVQSGKAKKLVCVVVEGK